MWTKVLKNVLILVILPANQSKKKYLKMFGLYSAPKPQSHQKKSKLNQKSLSKVWNQVTSQPPLPKKVLTCTEKNALKSLYFEMTASPFGKSKKKLEAIKNIIF